MVIHAGGYSKRLPSHSCSSKVFSALPVDVRNITGDCDDGGEGHNTLYTLLDLKLSMYLPFLSLMSPGDVFFTASDDLESFHIEEEDLKLVKRKLEELKSHQPMLCSLAHPSTLAVGTGHKKDICHMSLYPYMTYGIFQIPKIDIQLYVITASQDTASSDFL